MDDQVVAKKHCSNCKRDVTENNFVMHEIHCKKNIILCPKCSEPVPKVNLDEHIEEYHALINCDLCSRAVERSCLEQHKTDLCSKRSKICSFCELSVPADEIGGHEGYCGTRTEMCAKCQQYIMYKDRAMHDESNCRLPERIETLPKLDTESDFPYNDFSGVVDDFSLSPYSLLTDYEAQERLDGVFPRYTNYVDPYSVAERHQLNRNSDPPANSGFDRRGYRNPRLGSRRPGPNKWSRSEQHQMSEADDKLYDDFVKFALAKDSKPAQGSADNDLDFEGGEDGSFLPCEFCEESFPIDVIIQHQAMCSTRFEDTEFEENHAYRTNLLEHKPAKPAPAKSSFAESLYREATMLPCEFCCDLFANEELMSHQLNCEVRLWMNNDESEEFYGDVRRPPSLPLGLNSSSADGNSTQSSLKPSASVPLQLSKLEKFRDLPNSNLKPIPKANTNYQRNHVDGIAQASDRQPSRKLPSRPVGEEQVTFNMWDNEQANPRLGATGGGHPARLAPLEGRTKNHRPEDQSATHQMEATGVRVQRRGGATFSRSNPALHQHVVSRANGRAFQSRQPGSPDAPATFVPGHVYPRSIGTRPGGTGQNETQYRWYHGRLEGDGRGRRPYRGTTLNTQRKSSRMLQDPENKS